MLLEIGRIFICAKGERDIHLEAFDHWEDELAGVYWALSICNTWYSLARPELKVCI